MSEEENIDRIPDWRIRLLLRLGFPTTALIGLAVGFYQVAVWTGQNVISPIVQRQVQALIKLESLMESAERAARESNERGKENSGKLDQVLKHLEHKEPR